MERVIRGLLLVACVAACASATTASAQAGRRDEARATALREQGRALVREGRFDQAAERILEATRHTADASVWLELAAVGDWMRHDRLALDAYQRYLALRADAPDRVEIEARTRVLRAIVEGRRIVLPPPEPAPPEPPPQVATEAREPRPRTLVDWQGQPVTVPPRSVDRLAQWDGGPAPTAPPTAPAGPSVPELTPFPGTTAGLGRRLSQP